MIHVNSFLDGEIIAAYTAADDDVPLGTIEGRQGNAVIIREGELVHVISRPRSEGAILDIIPDAASAPEMDLSMYFF